MLASYRIGADTATPHGAHRDGDLAGTPWNALDRHYRNGNLAAEPASGNSDSGIAAAPGSGSQRLDYDSVFFLWQTGPWGGQVPGIG